MSFEEEPKFETELPEKSTEETAEEREERIINEKIREIADVLGNLPSEEEVAAAEEKIDACLEKFVRGGSLEKFHKEPDIDIPGKVEFPDFNILAKVMRIMGFEEDLIKQTVEHESAHIKEAKKFGFEPKLYLKFFKTKEEKKECQPWFQIELPKRGDEEELRKNLKIIVEAPLELSESDLKTLDMYE